MTPSEGRVALLGCDELTETAAGEKALVISVDTECRRTVATAPMLGYPLRQLSARPPEELNELILTVMRVAQAGGRIVIVGAGREDDRSCFIASAVTVALGGTAALQCPLSRAQEVAITWYQRLRQIIGLDYLHRLYEVGKAYEFGSGIEHASTVANVSLDLAQVLAGEKLGSGDLRALYAAGLLHDIGRFVSERKHEEVGVRMLAAHREALGDLDFELVAFCVKYHRRHTDPERDPAVQSLSDRGLLLAAVVRLADAFTNVYEKEDYWGVELAGEELRFIARKVNRERFEGKAKLLEKVTGKKVVLCHPE